MEPEKSLTCPRCGNRMQLGSIIDYGQNRFVSRQARWVEGRTGEELDHRLDEDQRTEGHSDYIVSVPVVRLP